MNEANLAQDGFGKFEETVHDLEQAAAEKADIAARQTQHSEPGRVLALSAAIRSRPAISMLIACVAGYALGRLADLR